VNQAALESKISVKFKNKDLLLEALTHRSYLNENPSWRISHNERLEFLGDAVLELAVTRYLFERYPEGEEGKLTLFRAALVNTKMLFKVAGDLGLQKHLLVSKGEAEASGKAAETILADAFEALVGAIYLDQGYETAFNFIKKILLPYLPEIEKSGLYKDSKSLLQEIVQSDYRVTPTYRVLEEFGPDHEKTFRVGVYFGDELKAKGTGASKQEAEIEAAKESLRLLGYSSQE